MKEPKAKNNNVVMVCMTDHPQAIVLLRIARSRALRIGGRWQAVFVETPEYTGNELQEHMLRMLTLAERMGGETVHIEAPTTEKGIIKLLESERAQITTLVLGSEEPKKMISFHTPPWERVKRYASKQHISLEIIPLSGQKYCRSLRERFNFFKFRNIIYALLSVGVAYVSAIMLEWILPPALFRINNQNIGLLFMTACAFSASRFGLLPGLVASVASFFTINYYFAFYSQNIASVTDLLNMAIFLFAALLISLFTSQTRGSAEKATQREKSVQVLFNLYRIAANASSRQQALENLQQQLVQTLGMEVAFFLPPLLNPDDIEPAFPADLVLNSTDTKAARLCWKEMKTTGLGSSYNAEASWRFEPMLATGGEIGVMGIKPLKRSQIDVVFGGLLSAIAEQTATVIEHIEMERSMEASRLNEEKEKLRSMLLSSVSHDLKTPLASIIGALAIYRSQGEKLSAEKRSALIETALEESERLDSFITNILDMTRLESRKIKFKQDWQDPINIVHEVLKRMEYRMRHHQVKIYPCPQRVEVYMDYLMTGQVIQNVLDNACKYTPAGTFIELHLTIAKQGNGEFCFEIRDYGSGLPSGKMSRVFDKYARLQMRDSQIAGTGLGLAISKTIMEAQGGSITVENHPEGGAIFAIYLPEWRIPLMEQSQNSSDTTLQQPQPDEKKRLVQ